MVFLAIFNNKSQFINFVNPLGLGKTGEHDVAVWIKQNVLQSQISVREAVGVQLAKRHYKLGTDKFYLLLCASLRLHPMMKKTAGIEVFQKVVDIVWVADRVLHFNYKWVLHFVQNFFF